MQAEANERNAKLEVQAKELEEIANEKERLSRELQDVQTKSEEELKEKSTAIEALEADRERLLKEVKSESEKCSKLETEVNRLFTQIEKKQGEIDEVRDGTNEMESEEKAISSDEWEAERVRFEREIKSESERCSSLESQVREKQSEIDRLLAGSSNRDQIKETLENDQVEISSSSARRMSVEEERDLLQQDNRRCTEQISQLQNEVDRLKNEIEELKKEIERLNQKLEDKELIHKTHLENAVQHMVKQKDDELQRTRRELDTLKGERESKRQRFQESELEWQNRMEALRQDPDFEYGRLQRMFVAMEGRARDLVQMVGAVPTGRVSWYSTSDIVFNLRWLFLFVRASTDINMSEADWDSDAFSFRDFRNAFSHAPQDSSIDVLVEARNGRLLSSNGTPIVSPRVFRQINDRIGSALDRFERLWNEDRDTLLRGIDEIHRSVREERLVREREKKDVDSSRGKRS